MPRDWAPMPSSWWVWRGLVSRVPKQLPTMAAVVWGTKKIRVPFIAAGGIADARGFVGALAMGADAVMMGTAFMLTKESPLKESLKDEILKTSPDDPRLLRRVLGSVDPRAYAEAQAMRGKVPLDEWLRMLERVNLKDDQPFQSPRASPGEEWGEQVVTAADPTRMVSLALAGIDRIPSVKELVDGIVRGAREILGRLDGIRE